MAFCHGNGNIETDGCCWVAGEPCPLRWKIVDGHILEGPDLVDLGTVDTYIDSVISSKAGRDRAKALAQGLTYACRAAIDVLATNPRYLTDRAGFNAAWNSHAGYVSLVRPHWEQVEDSLGLQRGEYQCSTWKGVNNPECCFAEPETENATKRQNLSATSVQIRQAGG